MPEDQRTMKRKLQLAEQSLPEVPLVVLHDVAVGCRLTLGDRVTAPYAKTVQFRPGFDPRYGDL